MRRYIYTKEGLLNIMGLRDINELSKKIKEVESFGFKTHEIKGGIAYYDADLLDGDWPQDKKLCHHIRKQKQELEKQKAKDKKDKCPKRCYHIQLDFSNFLIFD